MVSVDHEIWSDNLWDYYFDNGTYSDLTIVCGEKRFLVHKIIVCVQSPYIEGLYEQAHQGNTGPEIQILGADSEIVEMAILLMYGRDLEIECTKASVIQWLQVYQIAQRFEADEVGYSITDDLVRVIKTARSEVFIAEAICILCTDSSPLPRDVILSLGEICNDHAEHLKHDPDFMALLRSSPRFAMCMLETILFSEEYM